MQVGTVFVSHSSEDKAFVDRLVTDLRNRAIPVWYDRLDLRIGDSVPGKVNDGLASARYFLIVLSPEAIESRWVSEELNAATARQIMQGGTFKLPVLYKHCAVPPLLAHRRFADFRLDYTVGLNELLSVWADDVDACAVVKNDRLYPWPDVDMSDSEFVYLHSKRFNKFFRVSCSLDWTVDRAMGYLIETLDLPWSKGVPELGMRWAFNYSLLFSDKRLGLSSQLRDAGVQVGSVIQIGISGSYQDLFEKEQEEMRTTIFMMTVAVMEHRRKREEAIAEGLRQRGPLTSERLRELANRCFSHV